MATLGGVALLVIIVISALAFVLPLSNPNEIDPVNRLKLPFSEGAPLGTDHLGRDLLARLLWGTQISLMVGITAALLAALVGSVIGVIAGFYGGRVDHLIMRGVDTLMAFPYILLALAIVAVLGPGLLNALYAVATVNIPFFARNIRGVTIELSHREFIGAAQLAGMSKLRVITSEVIPHVLPVIVISISTTIGWMILETAGLSFLGLGSQPPQADLGSMLGEGRKLLLNAPHASIIPGAMIFIIVMSVNLLGDGVRDALDPRLQVGALRSPQPATLVQRQQAPAPKEPEKLLEVNALHVEFQIGSKTFNAVNDLNFSVATGDCLGIVGESSSGKSVTAMSLFGLTPSPPGVLTKGAVWIDGQDSMAMSQETLRQVRGRKVAYVFQDPLSTLHPLLKIQDQLIEAIRCHRLISKKEAWQWSVEMLNRVRIPNASERMNAYPYQLSGGMRQRVGIALALINEPQLLIADEPTTALDVSVQAQILALLNELRRERNLAVIFISHDFGVISQLCDRVAVMYAGQMVEIAPTEDILTTPQHPYTKRLIECVPKLGVSQRDFTTIEGVPPVTDNLPLGCAFAPRCHKVQVSCRKSSVPFEQQGKRGARCFFPEGAV